MSQDRIDQLKMQIADLEARAASDRLNDPDPARLAYLKAQLKAEEGTAETETATAEPETERAVRPATTRRKATAKKT